MKLIAGSYKPNVHINLRGFANTENVSPIEHIPSITSVTKSTGSVNGGAEIIVTGAFFPIS